MDEARQPGGERINSLVGRRLTLGQCRRADSGSGIVFVGSQDEQIEWFDGNCES